MIHGFSVHRSPLHPVSARSSLFILALATIAAPTAFAGVWSEAGDAGQTIGTAQVTGGAGTLTAIQGTIQSDTDVDLYCIHIIDPSTFSATLTCGTFAQNDLWLFNSGGIGREGNDACQFSAVLLTSAFVSGVGTYYLGISADGADAFSAGGNIWLTPAVQGARAPDGPGGAQPLINWAGTSAVTSILYSIQLAGCAFCDAPVPDSPGTWGRIKSFYR